LPLGQPCLNSSVCPGRLCITDALHPAPYCSKSCVTNGDCGNGLDCDPVNRRCIWPQIPPSKEGDVCTPGMTYCEPPTLCAGPTAQSSTCRKSCNAATDCTGNTTCTVGFSGAKYCAPPPEIRLKRATAEGTAAAGSCAAAPGLPLLLLAMLALRRRR
jgi:hypothetical protein